jgi:nitrogen regulatory protein PII-like uncharacterized protein
MRKCLLFFAFFWATVSVYAQSDIIAKLKFEEAEEAFQKGDFSSSIKKLDEAEKLLGVTNPKIEYLRILAYFNVIEQNSGNDYNMLSQARNKINFYLKNYTGASEEKYKEVYKISEQLNKYPKSLDEYNKIRLAEEVNRKEQLELQQKQKIASLDQSILKVKQNLIETKTRNKRKIIFNSIGLGAGFGLIVLGKELENNYNEDGYYEGTELVGGLLGLGLVVGTSIGLANGVLDSDSSHHKGILEKLETERRELTLTPTYNFNNKSAGFSLSMKF